MALTRGDSEGYLFCNIAGRSQLRFEHHVPWNRKRFLEFLHNSLHQIEIPPSETKLITGHSLKLRGVQFLRALVVQEQSIMAWFGMTGEGSYIRYTEICNRKTFNQSPAFSSLKASSDHYSAAQTLDERLQDEHHRDVMDWIFIDREYRFYCVKVF